MRRREVWVVIYDWGGLMSLWVAMCHAGISPMPVFETTPALGPILSCLLKISCSL